MSLADWSAYTTNVLTSLTSKVDLATGQVILRIRRATFLTRLMP